MNHVGNRSRDRARTLEARDPRERNGRDVDSRRDALRRRFF